MKNFLWVVLGFNFILVPSLSWSAPALTPATTPASSPVPVEQQSVTTEVSGKQSAWYSRIGISYFTFFDGPGLNPGSHEISPNVLGKPVDDGLRLSNFVSLKYKLNDSLAIDFQMRIQWVFNNANNVADYNVFRWQSPRIGISGKLLSGEDWALTGAANTDLPYSVPQPFGGGVIAQQRTTLFDPGLFAGFSYKPKLSKWSFFSLIMPRFFVYSNRDAAEPQLSRAGFSPELKNEFIFDVAPTVNYSLGHKTGLRLGTEFIYSKLILSNWNPFNASLRVSDTHSDAWRLAAVPLQFGITHEFNPALNVSVFLQGFPLAAQRFRNDGSQVSFLQTMSVGMWISGVVI